MFQPFAVGALAITATICITDIVCIAISSGKHGVLIIVRFGEDSHEIKAFGDDFGLAVEVFKAAASKRLPSIRLLGHKLSGSKKPFSSHNSSKFSSGQGN